MELKSHFAGVVSAQEPSGGSVTGPTAEPEATGTFYKLWHVLCFYNFFIGHTLIVENAGNTDRHKEEKARMCPLPRDNHC